MKFIRGYRIVQDQICMIKMFIAFVDLKLYIIIRTSSELFCSLLEDFPKSEKCWNVLAHRGLNEIKASKTNLPNLTGKSHGDHKLWESS